MAYRDNIHPKKIMSAIFMAAYTSLNEAGDRIVEEAIKFVPVKNGNLMRGIDKSEVQFSKSKGHLAIRVGVWGVPYAAAQEFGSAMRGEPLGSPPMAGWPEVPSGKKTWGFYTIRPVKKPNLRFQIDGKWISTKEVIHPGVPAKPYMRPAIDSVVRNPPVWAKIIHRNTKREFSRAGFEVM